MPFPLIPFLLGAAVGSVLTYAATRKSDAIEIAPTKAQAADERDKAPKQGGAGDTG